MQAIKLFIELERDNPLTIIPEIVELQGVMSVSEIRETYHWKTVKEWTKKGSNK